MFASEQVGWVSESWGRREQGTDAAWSDRLARMVEKARTHGWVRDEPELAIRLALSVSLTADLNAHSPVRLATEVARLRAGEGERLAAGSTERVPDVERRLVAVTGGMKPTANAPVRLSGVHAIRARNVVAVHDVPTKWPKFASWHLMRFSP